MMIKMKAKRSVFYNLVIILHARLFISVLGKGEL